MARKIRLAAVAVPGAVGCEWTSGSGLGVVLGAIYDFEAHPSACVNLTWTRE